MVFAFYYMKSVLALSSIPPLEMRHILRLQRQTALARGSKPCFVAFSGQ
jgi:hypothetical protein